MHDNKVRLSSDVLEKAERIAAEWGLKNARAAVEAVFRTYCDDYLYGRTDEGQSLMGRASVMQSTLPRRRPSTSTADLPQCEALDALDQLLAL